MKDERFTKITEVETIRPSKPDDLFLCASSFEVRGLKVVSRFATYQAKQSIIFRYKDNLSGRKKTEGEYFEELNRRLTNVTLNKKAPHLIYGYLREPEEPIEEFSKLLKGVLGNKSEPRITIDITCFTKLYLVALLAVIMERVGNTGSIRLLYTEPREYSKKRLSYGIQGDPIHLPLLNGAYTEGKKLLLLFGGHEGEREALLWRDDEPDFIYLILKESEGEGKEWDEKAKSQHKFLIGRCDAGDPTIRYKFVSIWSPLKLANDIFREVKKFFENGFTNIWIAPLGPKPEVVAIYELISRIREWYGSLSSELSVRLVYPVPSDYDLDGYSRGMGQMWKWQTYASTPSWIHEKIKELPGEVMEVKQMRSVLSSIKGSLAEEISDAREEHL